MTKKEEIKNRLFIRRTNNYTEYKTAGGTGTEKEYNNLVIEQENKTKKVEDLIVDNFK